MTSADEDCMYAYNIRREISNFRTVIQNLKFLQQPTLKSVSGKDIDPDLTNISQKAKEHRRQNFLWLHDKPLGTKKNYEPVFVLPGDRANYEAVENKTKAEISKLVEKQLKLIGDQKLEEKWTKIKRKTKADFLSFLAELQIDDEL